mmetsp:Transcript_39440/g.85836  ORF Transcript_39440/g.85836 Transcript_39440/m.85836 type:complete len:221 (-) Transcript_39440:417-1079(-)
MLLISDFLVRSRFTRSPTLRTIRLMCSFCGLRVDVSVVRAGISPNHSSMAGLLICAGPASASLVGLRASGAAAAASSAGAGGAQITSPEVGRSVDTPSAFSCCSLQLLSAASKYLLAGAASCSVLSQATTRSLSSTPQRFSCVTLFFDSRYSKKESSAGTSVCASSSLRVVPASGGGAHCGSESIAENSIGERFRKGTLAAWARSSSSDKSSSRSDFASL